MTREEAINTLGNFKRYISGGGVTDRKANEALDMAIEALEQGPKSVSRWIDADLDSNFAKCKNCSEHEVDIAYSKDFIKQESWNFCPYCGADIKGE